MSSLDAPPLSGVVADPVKGSASSAPTNVQQQKPVPKGPSGNGVKPTPGVTQIPEAGAISPATQAAKGKAKEEQPKPASGSGGDPKGSPGKPNKGGNSANAEARIKTKNRQRARKNAVKANSSAPAHEEPASNLKLVTAEEVESQALALSLAQGSGSEGTRGASAPAGSAAATAPKNPPKKEAKNQPKGSPESKNTPPVKAWAGKGDEKPSNSESSTSIDRTHMAPPDLHFASKTVGTSSAVNNGCNRSTQEHDHTELMSQFSCAVKTGNRRARDEWDCIHPSWRWFDFVLLLTGLTLLAVIWRLRVIDIPDTRLGNLISYITFGHIDTTDVSIALRKFVWYVDWRAVFTFPPGSQGSWIRWSIFDVQANNTRVSTVTAVAASLWCVIMYYGVSDRFRVAYRNYLFRLSAHGDVFDIRYLQLSGEQLKPACKSCGLCDKVRAAEASTAMLSSAPPSFIRSNLSWFTTAMASALSRVGGHPVALHMPTRLATILPLTGTKAAELLADGDRRFIGEESNQPAYSYLRPVTVSVTLVISSATIWAVCNSDAVGLVYQNVSYSLASMPSVWTVTPTSWPTHLATFFTESLPGFCTKIAGVIGNRY